MKKLLALAFSLWASCAAAQQGLPNHSVPVSPGPGVQGWRTVGPCGLNQVIIWTGGTGADPACGSAIASLALPTGQIFVGNASNVAAAVAMSGDCSIILTGVVTCNLNASRIVSGNLNIARMPSVADKTVFCNYSGATATVQACDDSSPYNLALPHGSVQFVNNGTASDMLLAPFNGGSIIIPCSTTGLQKKFTLPPDISITNVTNAGGLFRITHAATTRPFVNGQWVWIQNVVGGGGMTAAINLSWAITNVTATTFDLASSVFTGTYTSGGTVSGDAVIRRDNITINGTPNQTLANSTAYAIGAKYIDADCTVITMVASTASWVPNSIGVFVLGNDANATLVGGAAPFANTIQGGANSELVIGWFNRRRVAIAAGISGNTGGVTGSYVLLTGSIELISWPDESPTGIWSYTGTCTAAANTQFAITLDGGATQAWTSGMRHPDTGTYNGTLVIPHEGHAFNFFRYQAMLLTDTGTCSSGNTQSSVLMIQTTF